MKKKQSKGNVILLIISLFIALILIELFMKIIKLEYPIFQTYDFNRGFALRENTSGWWLREGEAFVKINSVGLRDIEHEKQKNKGTLRIAILGDSFAEARPVSLEKTFWFLLGEKLNKCTPKGFKEVEVINFGVTEYSTAQELLTLRHHVWDYNPDMILLAFFSGNDVSDNSKKLSRKKYRPFFIYKDGELIIDNSFRDTKTYILLKSKLGRTVSKLSDYSRIMQFMKEFYIKWHFGNLVMKKQNDKQDNDYGFLKLYDEN